MKLLSSLLPSQDSKMFKNILQLFYGNIIVQTLTLIAYPILSRQYSPAEFGIFAVFNSIVLILALLATGRYEVAIIITNRRHKAVQLLYMTLGLALISVIIITISFYFWGQDLLSLVNIELDNIYVQLLSLGLVLFLLLDIYLHWFNSQKQYKKIRNITVVKRLTYLAGAIGLGFFDIQYNGLIIALLVSSFLSCFLLPRIKLKRLKYFNKFFNNKESFKEYSDFPKYLMPDSIMTMIAAQIPIILIISLFSDMGLTGQFSMAYRLLSLPEVIIAASIGQVFRQRIAAKFNMGEDIKPIIYKTLKQLFILGIGPCSIFMVWGDKVIIYLLGPEWSIAGELAIVMAPLFLIMFINTPTNYSFTVYRLQHILPWFGIATIGIRAGALYIGHLNNDIIFGIQLLVWAEIIIIIIKNFFIIRHSPKTLSQ